MKPLDLWLWVAVEGFCVCWQLHYTGPTQAEYGHYVLWPWIRWPRTLWQQSWCTSTTVMNMPSVNIQDTVSPPPTQLHGGQFHVSTVYVMWHLLAKHGAVSLIHGLCDLSTHSLDAKPILGAHHPLSEHLTSSSTVSWNTVPSGNEICVFGEGWLHTKNGYVRHSTYTLFWVMSIRVYNFLQWYVFF